MSNGDDPIERDAAFLRRASLDAIGLLPSPAELQAFVADPASDKRAKLIDQLLDLFDPGADGDDARAVELIRDAMEAFAEHTQSAGFCRPLGIEPPLHRRRAAFFTKDRAFSIDRARQAIGYSPQVELTDGLRQTADWYRDQELLG